MHDLPSLQKQAETELHETADGHAIEAWRVKWLSRKGLVQQAVDQLGQLLRDERAEYGKAVNQVKQAVQAAYDARLLELKVAKLAAELSADGIDVTLPVR